MVHWNLFTGRLAVVAAVCLTLFAVGTPSATGKPETDARGFINSAARCNPPEAVVVFGSTDGSRVAICKTPSGQYEYRGVRMSDGAKLVAPAVQASSGAFVAEDEGNTYTLTSSSLIVTSGEEVISKESMVDFYQPGTGGAKREKSTP
jgi:hypothetical protein